jgi:glutaredoxin 3
MANIELYSTGICPYCVMAKQLLQRKNADYTEIRIDLDTEKRDEMIARSKQRTVPQIFINGDSIGGYTDLVALDRNKQLDSLLAAS